MEYPTWRYHRTERPVIVSDPTADEALGEGWADSPAAFAEEEPEPESADSEAPAPKRRK